MTATKSANHSAMSSANFPTDAENRVYHLGLRAGDLTNRVITVGDPSRAILAATYLDGGKVINAAEYKKFLNYRDENLTIITSKRMFTTITGRYNGTPVSIIAIGMGMPMMDFFVREARSIVQGEMHIIRLGSCGSIGKATAGALLVASESRMCIRNPDFFVADGKSESAEATATPLHSLTESAYILSKPVSADEKLTKALAEALRSVCESVNPCEVRIGADVTADSFYSSQGRQDASFADANDTLIEEIHAVCGDNNVESLQMETFQLLHLARSAAPHVPVRAAACAMVFANRAANSWITPEQVEALEPVCCKAVLDAVTAIEIPADRLHPEDSPNCLWGAAAKQ